MAEYAVECADKIDGKPYVIRVEADTHQHAIEKAAAQHEVRRAHRMDFTPAPPRPTIEEEMLAAMREQNVRLADVAQRLTWIHSYHQSLTSTAVRALVYFFVFVVGLFLIGMVARPFFWLGND